MVNQNCQQLAMRRTTVAKLGISALLGESAVTVVASSSPLVVKTNFAKSKSPSAAAAQKGQKNMINGQLLGLIILNQQRLRKVLFKPHFFRFATITAAAWLACLN